jgi:hypothetical protein
MQVVGLADLLSYFAAAVASLGNATANVMQRKAGLAQAAGTAFNAGFLARLVRDRTWLFGMTLVLATAAGLAVGGGVISLAQSPLFASDEYGARSERGLAGELED